MAGIAAFISTSALPTSLVLTEQAAINNWTSGERQDMLTELTPSGPKQLQAASAEAIVILSLLFCCIGCVGIIGNFLVIYIILSDRKMRNSVTNLFIMNLACADFLIMVFGIPEIVQFMMNKGWVMGIAPCKFQRFTLVFALYASVMTLVSVCVERYIAIVHPLKAHLFCSRKKILIAIACIWPLALLCGLPTALYNQVKRPHPRFPAELCMILFPGHPKKYYMVFKFLEFIIFFLGPVVIQMGMYTVIGRRLFASTEKLHRKQAIKNEDGVKKEQDSDAIKARKGVIKMLIACVVIYFVSYAPTQVPLFYNAFSRHPFKQNWSFLVFLMTMGYINSAANPILYSIFSQNFRRKFSRILCSCYSRSRLGYRRTSTSTMDSMSSRHPTRFISRRFSTGTSVMSEM